MNMLTIAHTRTPRLPAPEALPEINETPRSAFLAGWWGGIFTGAICGAGFIVVLLDQLGRLKP